MRAICRDASIPMLGIGRNGLELELELIESVVAELRSLAHI
jgi:hypothetical protein